MHLNYLQRVAIEENERMMNSKRSSRSSSYNNNNNNKNNVNSLPHIKTLRPAAIYP